MVAICSGGGSWTASRGRCRHSESPVRAVVTMAGHSVRWAVEQLIVPFLNVTSRRSSAAYAMMALRALARILDTASDFSQQTVGRSGARLQREVPTSRDSHAGTTLPPHPSPLSSPTYCRCPTYWRRTSRRCFATLRVTEPRPAAPASQGGRAVSDVAGRHGVALSRVADGTRCEAGPARLLALSWASTAWRGVARLSSSLLLRGGKL